jgi:hypothetical protein
MDVLSEELVDAEKAKRPGVEISPQGYSAALVCVAGGYYR